MSNLTFAIQMEVDGEQYYLSQAEIFKGTSLQRAFIILADTEKKHAYLLRKLSILSDESVDENATDFKEHSLFLEKADFMRDYGVVPGQLEVYAFARDMEKKSIDLYQKMLDETKDEANKKLVEFLIKEEQEHYTFFDELITLVERPRDWVEDAEFGIREDY